MNEAERGAAADIVTGTSSKVREVNISLFSWPNERNSGLVGVLQYEFVGASPAGCCWSIGLLVHLIQVANGWRVKDRYLLEMMHHTSVAAAHMVDLTGDGSDELVVESDTGGAGTHTINLHIFDLHQRFFDEILHVYSDLSFEDQEGYRRALDVSRTLHYHGTRFCFVESLLFEKGKRFDPPKVSRPCYKRGDGVDNNEPNTQRLLH